MKRAVRFGAPVNRIVAAALSAAALWPAGAAATLLFSADLNGVPAIRCADNQAPGGLCPGDINPAIGILALADNVFGGLVDLKGSVQTSTNGTQKILNSSSLQLTALAAVHIDAAAGDTGFAGPANQADASASGTIQTGIGTKVAYSFYDDPLNAQGAGNPFATPGALIDAFAFTATQIADAYAHAGGPFAVNDPGLFSMTQTFAGDLPLGAVLVGNSQTEIKSQLVSEPGTLALLGSALIGCWVWWGRKRIKIDWPRHRQA